MENTSEVAMEITTEAAMEITSESGMENTSEVAVRLEDLVAEAVLTHMGNTTRDTIPRGDAVDWEVDKEAVLAHMENTTRDTITRGDAVDWGVDAEDAKIVVIVAHGVKDSQKSP